MWQHLALVALVLSVPAQYLMSKYWTGLVTPEGYASSHSRSSYFLQRTFASLDEKLKLEEWSRWPHELVQCAKRFVFDYITSVAPPDSETEATASQKVPASSSSQPKKRLVVPKPKKVEETEPVDDEKAEDEKKILDESGGDVESSESVPVVEEKDEPFDENIHFGGSREPRTPRHPDVVYRVGQVFRHLKHKYRGVIVGWDVRPQVPAQVAKIIFTRDKQEVKNQPFYASLIDTRDRVTPQLDYVAQEYIQPVYNTVVVHPILYEYFESSRPDEKTGRYLMRPRLRTVYPDD